MLLARHYLDLGRVLVMMLGCTNVPNVFLSTGMVEVRISHDKPHICIFKTELASGILDWLLHLQLLVPMSIFLNISLVVGQDKHAGWLSAAHLATLRKFNGCRINGVDHCRR